MFGEFPHFAFRHAQHLGHFRKRAPGLERREAAHHGAMLAAVFLEDEFHHVVFAVVREINVDVRQFVQRHALLVQKAPEVEVEADRAHAADAEAIADQPVRRAAARDPFDAAPPAVLEEVPGDEKIFLVTDVADDAQVPPSPAAGTDPAARPVAFAQSLQHQPAQKFAGR